MKSITAILTFLLLVLFTSTAIAQPKADGDKADKEVAPSAEAGGTDAAAKEPAPTPPATAPVAGGNKAPGADQPEVKKKEAPSGFFGVIGDYFSKGGPMMIVIFLVSLFGTAMFFERGYGLYLQAKLDAGPFLDKVLRHVERREFRRALDACNVPTKHPLTAVVRAGVLRANRREKEIERAMEKEMLAALPNLQKRVALMSLLANSATLLGLLGTIFGLIGAFNSVAMASAAERQEALAGGISTAMYTTAFGITVAVPLLFFHHFLSKRAENITMEIEEGASSVLVALAGDGKESQERGSRRR